MPQPGGRNGPQQRRPVLGETCRPPRAWGSTHIIGERVRMPRVVVSRVLNQMGDTGGAAAVTAVYDRNEYLHEKRQALTAWVNLLAEIAGPGSRSHPERFNRR